jgi:hypothetical protein
MKKCVILLLFQNTQGTHLKTIPILVRLFLKAAMAYIVSHPLLIVPAEGEFADEEEDVMVVGEHKDVVHLFQGVLAEGVRDGVRPLPPSAEGVTVSNSVVMMKWEDYEKRVLGAGMPGKRKRDDEERLRERLRVLERENASLMGEGTSLRVQNKRLQDRAKEFESRNAVLEGGAMSHKAELQTLRDEVYNLKITIDVAKHFQSLAESKHKKLTSSRDKRVADAEAKASAELERITKTKDEVITDLMAQVNTLINLCATKDAERAIHEAELKKARIEIAQQSNEIYMLQKKNKELTTRYGHIQAQLYDMACKYEPRCVDGGV